MQYNKLPFEEFLRTIHADQYIGIDDDMSDNFDNWLGDLDNEELINWADKYSEVIYVEGQQKGLEDAKLIFNS